MARKYDLISDVYDRLTKTIVSSPEKWQDFLKSACRNYKLRFDEQLLVYEQRPDAIAVLEIEKWGKLFDRRVNRGAVGIAVFEDAQRVKQRLVHYFDISDTHAGRNARPVPIWNMKDEYAEDIIATLESTFGELENKETLGKAVVSAAHNAVEDNLADYTADLLQSTGGSFLEGLDTHSIGVMHRTCVTNSVAYMMLSRLGIDPSEYFETEDFRDVVNFTTQETLNALGLATSEIAEMGLSEISRTIRSLERNNRTIVEKEKEEYNKYENRSERRYEYERDHLQRAGGLSAAQSDNAGAARSELGSIRRYAEEIPEREAQSAVLQSGDQSQTGGASGRSREESNGDGRDAGETDGRAGRSDRADESSRHDDLGQENEQYQKPGTGNRDGRSDLRLEYHDREHEDRSLPFFGKDEDIQEILLRTPHLKVSRDEIRRYLEESPDPNSRTEFIKNIFNPEYTELTLEDGRRVGYKAMQNVLHLWEGSYQERTAQSYFNWSVIAAYFDGLRLLGQLYDVAKPVPTIEGQLNMADENAEHLRPAFSFSQEIIDAVLCRGSGVSQGKLRIYEQYQKSLSDKENAKFLKEEYGWGGAYPVIAGTGLDELHDGKGIHISKGIGADKPSITLSWIQVEKRIKTLIDLDRYLNPKEKEVYPEWQAEQEERRTAVEAERRNREILAKDPAEKETVAKTYQYHLGDTVYLGASEYEILSFDNDKVRLYDTSFPLLNKEMSRSDFDEAIRADPSNDHLAVDNAALQVQTEQIEETAYPVGRIEYLGSDGKTGESVEYTDARELEVDLRSENYAGVPMRVILYKKPDGTVMPHQFISNLDPPINELSIIDAPTQEKDLAEKVVDFLKDYDFYGYQDSLEVGDDTETEVSKMANTIQDDPDSILEFLHKINESKELNPEEQQKIDDLITDIKLEKAMNLIDTYCQNEFQSDEGADYSDLTNIPLGFTTTEDDKHEIQVRANLENFQIETLVDDVVVRTEKYQSLDDMTEKALSNLDFDELTYVSEDELARAKSDVSFVDHYYVVEDLQVRGPLAITEYSNLEDAITAYHALPKDKVKALGIQNTNRPLPGSLDLIQCVYGADKILDDWQKVGGWNNPEIVTAVQKLEEYIAHDIKDLESPTPVYTPWGPAESSELISEGIYEVEAENHGGLMIDTRAAEKTLSQEAQNIGFLWGGYRCYDEIHDADVPVLELLGQGLYPVPDNESFTPETYKEEVEKQVQKYHPQYWSNRKQSLENLAAEAERQEHLRQTEREKSIELLTPRNRQIVAAMNIAGFVYEPDKGSQTIVFNASDNGYPISFESWAQAEDWISSAELKDEPGLRDKVQAILNPEKKDINDEEPRWNRILPERRTYDSHPEVPDAERHNFELAEHPVESVPKKERFQRNIRAIQTLKKCESEKRFATDDEQILLSKYVGWGGMPEAFDENNSAWSAEYLSLKKTLNEEEYAAAKESTLTAFYTPPEVISAVYSVMNQMGFQTGNILEPACGIGHFMGMLPKSMRESKLYGVELDNISARIAQQLYQKASIAACGFEETDLPDSFFDAVVGNVPFGDFKVNDNRYDKQKFLIHDYFFAKSLDKLRPGGILAFVTSKGTMDKENPAVRKYIAQRADLLGAIRLPNNVFKGNAGTEVVSDILFLQKRDRLVDLEPSWIHLGLDENGRKMNSYFIEHPEMVLGEWQTVTGRFGEENTVVPYENMEFSELLAEAVSNIHGEITVFQAEETLEEEDNTIPADPAVRNFSYTIVDDKVYYRENSRMVPKNISVTAENRIKGMIQIRDCVRNLIDLQREDMPDGEIHEAQEKLNELYDTYTEKYGLLSSRANASAFSQDSSYSLLSALEVVDENGKLERKADLFTKRTIRPHIPITSVDTASEALSVSMGEKACVDMPYMEELSGKSEEELFKDLKGVIFLNPMYGSEKTNEEKYLTADEYLSGNVREKLDLARRSAVIYPDDYKVNVEALEKVQPKDLSASEISVRLGATWVPPDIVEQFVFELLNTPRYAQWNIKVHFSKFNDQWNIEGKSYDRSNIKAYSTYGTDRINAYKIIEETLNLKDVRIFDYVEDMEGKRKAVLNKKETAIAQAKQEQIKQAFQNWIWEDPDRRERLCKIYNEKFNSVRPREYDGQHIVFSGMNPEIELHEHQKNAVAHILYGGNTLLAHCVGAGKTYEMVAAAMESKRLGLCSKSLFVVPNHLTEQWAAEFLQLYPAANILVATKKDFETKNRKKFCGRIATGDYDAVIIGHSQFEKIPMSIERQKAILQKQLDEVVEGIMDLRQNRGDHFSIKQMERTKKTLKAKLEKLNDQSRKDDVVTFEELGVDRLFIDESHYYKNRAKRCA